MVDTGYRGYCTDSKNNHSGSSAPIPFSKPASNSLSKMLSELPGSGSPAESADHHYPHDARVQGFHMVRLSHVTEPVDFPAGYPGMPDQAAAAPVAVLRAEVFARPLPAWARQACRECPAWHAASQMLRLSRPCSAENRAPLLQGAQILVAIADRRLVQQLYPGYGSMKGMDHASCFIRRYFAWISAARVPDQPVLQARGRCIPAILQACFTYP